MFLIREELKQRLIAQEHDRLAEFHKRKAIEHWDLSNEARYKLMELGEEKELESCEDSNSEDV